MKVLTITNLSKDKETELFIDTLLSKKIFNDAVFDQKFFQLNIKLDSCVDYIYRTLWETVYLKSSRISTYDENTNTISMYLSLSEAIGFIYKTTPPRLQNLIPDSITSISSIIEVLEQFLMDDNSGQLLTYHSYFRNYTHLEPFETKWTYNMERMKLLRKNVPNGLIVDLEAYNVPFDELFDGSIIPYEHACVQMTFHCTNESDVKEMIKILYNEKSSSISDYEQRYPSWHISNVYSIKINNNNDLYVTVYSTWVDSISFSLKEIIQRTYSPIMK